MPRSLLFSCFVAICLTGLAQETELRGVLVDEKTEETIPFVNLSFINTVKGTSSDERGRFSMIIDDSFLDKKVHISCLGFKEKVLTASELAKDGVIFLEPESYELNEIIVLGDDLSGEFVMNPIGSRSLTSGFVSTSTPWILATHFEKPKEGDQFINKIRVFYKRNRAFGDHPSKFRIRIFGVNPETKSPDSDLISESIIVESGVEEDVALVDLSKYKIEVPEDGFYVGLEWLFIPSNWYKETIKDPLGEKTLFVDRFAPTFAAVFRLVEQNRTMIYSMGNWSNFIITSKDNSKKLVPAISVTLSI